MTEVLGWIGQAIQLYTYVLFARMIMGFVLSFTQYRPSGGAAVAFEVVYTITDPPLKFLRRFIPMLRVGNFAVDLSFIVLVIVLQIIANELIDW
ncbi:MAG TPA: YggT family protein [Frankiaceae bacterium]|nr:YggT family protein [Frankiaceae bacterium]